MLPCRGGLTGTERACGREWSAVLCCWPLLLGRVLPESARFTCSRQGRLLLLCVPSSSFCPFSSASRDWYRGWSSRHLRICRSLEEARGPMHSLYGTAGMCYCCFCAHGCGCVLTLSMQPCSQLLGLGHLDASVPLVEQQQTQHSTIAERELG